MVRGVGEARKVLEECGRMYGIRFRERIEWKAIVWSRSGEKIADDARKRLSSGGSAVAFSHCQR